VLTGGAGADKFLFNAMETSANRDTITDFAVAEDKIQFSKSVFTGFTGNSVTASMFASSTGTMLASTRLIYNNTTGVLSYDADGSGTQSQAIEVALIGVNTHAQLAASHFAIVA
jgi:Ca2+-binding RTX toxin-like protein